MTRKKNNKSVQSIYLSLNESLPYRSELMQFKALVLNINSDCLNEFIVRAYLLNFFLFVSEKLLH